MSDDLSRPVPVLVSRMTLRSFTISVICFLIYFLLVSLSSQPEIDTALVCTNTTQGVVCHEN